MPDPLLPDCMIPGQGPPCASYLKLLAEMGGLDLYPGVNETTIREAVAAGNVDWLLSFFNHIQKSKHRAESLSRAYFAQMQVFHNRLEDIRSGGSGLSEQPREPRRAKPTPGPVTRSPPAPNFEKAIEL